MSPRLQVRDLRIAFGDRAVVEALSFDVAAGEIVGLVGPSGSGKSLTARAILGLPPKGARVTGGVRLDGRELIGLDERALCAVRGRGVGLVFQEPATALDPVAAIGTQVAEGIGLQSRATRAEARRQAQAWLARVGLADIPLSRRAHQLSGGQRQRVAIAAALALRPAVLIADEPTTALDALTQADIARLLADLARREGSSLLLISHDLALVAALADRLVILRDGRPVAAGPTPAVFDDPRPELQALRHAASPLVPLSDGNARAPGPTLLEAKGLWRTYPSSGRNGGGSPAGVRDVSLELHAGERLAILGETGAGKSTLLRLLLALDRPDRGEVRLCGELFSPAPAGRQRALRRHIQPVFQDPAGSFDPLWTLARLVAEPLALLSPRLRAAEAAARVIEALETVGLSAEFAQRPAASLSGGQRQRLALARALVVEPRVLVLDEATSALDEESRSRVLGVLHDLGARRGLACLLVTHDLALVRGFADRIAVLHEGRIVETGPTAHVLDAPRDAYTRALVSATPDLAKVLARRAAAQA